METDTQTKYRNPRCACALRVNKYLKLSPIACITKLNWLEAAEDGIVWLHSVVFRLQVVCHYQKRVPRKATWINTLCNGRFTLAAHKESGSHCEAVHMELALHASKKDNRSAVLAQRKDFY